MLTPTYTALILILILLMLPIISLIISLPGMLHSDMERTHERFIAKRNHIAKLHFKRIDYKSYPMGLIKFHYEYVQPICDQENSYNIYMEEQTGEIALLRNHVGHCDLTITKYWSYDLLGLFRKKHKCLKNCSMYIEPNVIDIDKDIRQFDVFVDDSDIYSPYRHGNDYSELFEIREYRQGDKLRRINWRNSLIRQKIYMNVGSQPIVKNVVVALLTTDNYSDNDKAFDYFHSMCIQLLKKKMIFDIVYQNITMPIYEIYNIKCSDDYEDVLHKMLSFKMNINQRFTLDMFSNGYGYIYTATANGIEEQKWGGS